MLELLKELMNYGYVVFYNDSNFRVMKIETAFDSSNTLDDQRNFIDFSSYADAIAFCKERIGWVDPEPAVTAVNSNLDTFWQMELMYRHRGLGLQSAILGQLKKVSYERAKEIAKERADDYLGGFKDEVESWEVRVRPCEQR
jgi:hypothetical protein